MISNYILFGERNSGTNYIKKLIENNFINLNNSEHFIWKHSNPDINQINDNSLIIIIVRELKSWLNSMYNRPYCIKTVPAILSKNLNIKDKNLFNHFITKKHHTKYKNEKWSKYNLFELRYKKYEKYKDLYSKYNCAFINLNYLQQYPENFIKILKNTFNLKGKEEFKDIVKHTKTNKKNIINEKYKTFPIFKKNFKYINKQYKNEINKLTIKINKI